MEAYHTCRAHQPRSNVSLPHPLFRAIALFRNTDVTHRSVILITTKMRTMNIHSIVGSDISLCFDELKQLVHYKRTVVRDHKYRT